MTDAPEADPKTIPEEVVEPVAPAAVTKAAVVVGAQAIPKGYDLVIFTETVAKDADGAVIGKNTGFPAGAFAYLRYDAEVKFPPKADKVFTMGDNLKQHTFAGFTRVDGFVNVGPAHPAFGAANLAFQQGATAIDIIGLTADEKERLQVWFDALSTDAVEPAQVAVNLA